jgi:protein-S-isoprenylcysteine O-methyltransferase Ste14
MERPPLARFRVPLGFASAAVGMAFAHPTATSLLAGGAIAVVGEAVRVWASGHLEKGREVTRSGPYRLVRHPLYLGSSIIGLGFMVAANSVWVALLVAAYLATTLLAAMRSEEAHLDAKFGGEYSAYRDGRAEPVDRPFSLARVRENQEYRAVAGLALGLGLLYLRSLL